MGYQRKFDSCRADEIAEDLNTEVESIPSSIVLSAQDVAELSYSSKTKQLSYQRVAEAFAVLDGQPRLWGYHKCRTLSDGHKFGPTSGIRPAGRMGWNGLTGPGNGHRREFRLA